MRSGMSTKRDMPLFFPISKTANSFLIISICHGRAAPPNSVSCAWQGPLSLAGFTTSPELICSLISTSNITPPYSPFNVGWTRTHCQHAVLSCSAVPWRCCNASVGRGGRGGGAKCIARSSADRQGPRHASCSYLPMFSASRRPPSQDTIDVVVGILAVDLDHR